MATAVSTVGWAPPSSASTSLPSSFSLSPLRNGKDVHGAGGLTTKHINQKVSHNKHQEKRRKRKNATALRAVACVSTTTGTQSEPQLRNNQVCIVAAAPPPSTPPPSLSRAFSFYLPLAVAVASATYLAYELLTHRREKRRQHKLQRQHQRQHQQQQAQLHQEGERGMQDREENNAARERIESLEAEVAHWSSRCAEAEAEATSSSAHALALAESETLLAARDASLAARERLFAAKVAALTEQQQQQQQGQGRRGHGGGVKVEVKVEELKRVNEMLEQEMMDARDREAQLAVTATSLRGELEQAREEIQRLTGLEDSIRTLESQCDCNAAEIEYWQREARAMKRRLEAEMHRTTDDNSNNHHNNNNHVHDVELVTRCARLEDELRSKEKMILALRAVISSEIKELLSDEGDDEGGTKVKVRRSNAAEEA